MHIPARSLVLLSAAALVSGCAQSDPSPPQPAPRGASTQQGVGEDGLAKPKPAAAAEVKPPMGGVEAVAVGERMDCARRKDGSVWCWRGSVGAKRSIMVNADKVAVVDGFICAIQTKGQIACSQPYRGKILDVPLYRDGVTIEGSPEGYCVDTEDGVLRCGVQDDEKTKVKPPSGLPGLKHPSAFAVGMKYGFGIVDGDVWCWNNEKGPGLPKTMAPVEGAKGLAVGRQRACIHTDAGEVWCYDLTAEETPFQAKPGKVETWGSVAALRMAYSDERRDRLCALRVDGTVACGSLTSDGAGASFEPPVGIEGLSDAVELATGATAHGCARTKRGTVACWQPDAKRAVEVHEAAGGGVVPASIKR